MIDGSGGEWGSSLARLLSRWSDDGDSELGDFEPFERASPVFALLPLLPSLLSLLGSSMIIYLICREKRTNTYKRLVLGLSCWNIVNAVQFPMQAFLVPNGLHAEWAFGNHRTCVLLGFLMELALGGPIYNGMLSFYFLLTIRYGVNEKVMSQRWEPFMHIFASAYPLAIALIVVVVDSYEKVIMAPLCYLALTTVAIYSTLGPVVLSWGSIAISHTLIYTFVRTTVYRSNMYSQHYAMNNNHLTDGDDPFNSNDNISTRTSMSASLFGGSRRRGRRRGGRGMLAQTLDKRVRAVANQGLLYVIAFSLCHWCPVALALYVYIRGYEESHWSDFAMPYLYSYMCVFFPLQGFFNCFIYIRPSYMKCREQYPEETKFWALQRVVLGARRVPQKNFALSLPEKESPPCVLGSSCSPDHNSSTDHPPGMEDDSPLSSAIIEEDEFDEEWTEPRHRDSKSTDLARTTHHDKNTYLEDQGISAHSKKEKSAHPKNEIPGNDPESRLQESVGGAQDLSSLMSNSNPFAEGEPDDKNEDPFASSSCFSFAGESIPGTTAVDADDPYDDGAQAIRRRISNKSKEGDDRNHEIIVQEGPTPSVENFRDDNAPLSSTATHNRRPTSTVRRRRAIAEARLEEMCSQVQHLWEAMAEDVD